MSTTKIYNVVGITQHNVGNSVFELKMAYACMTRVEMMQAIRKANDEGHPIVEWIAQTKQGEKMLTLKHMPKMVDCPICEGHGCVVCNYSKITTPGHWEKWLPWQLEEIRKGALENINGS